jgi:hypothetical protein
VILIPRVRCGKSDRRRYLEGEFDHRLSSARRADAKLSRQRVVDFAEEPKVQRQGWLYVPEHDVRGQVETFIAAMRAA